jgi:LPXTG-motif cell wall-anchored protein/uncharacterized repeat protein (TIGR02543 family)
MKFTKKGKLLAVLVAVLMVATMLPATVLADTVTASSHSHNWQGLTGQKKVNNSIIVKTDAANMGLINHSESDTTLNRGDTWHFTPMPKSGYEFDYWEFVNKDLVNVQSGANDLVLVFSWKNAGVSSSNKFEAIAHFKASTQYTVTFKDWDGSVLKTDTVDYGGDATPPTDPTRDNYTFAGWFGNYEDVTENRTITAKYTINQYTVTYHRNGGTGDLPSPETVPYNTPVTVADGSDLYYYDYSGLHIFDHWNTQRYGYGGTDYYPDNTITITGDEDLYARYTRGYTVTFKDWDGNVIGTPQKVKKGSDATAPTPPPRTGYTFDGWDTSFTNVQKNLTVTATYTINQYTLTYHRNGGTGEPSGGTAAGTYDYNTAITAAAAGTLSKTGHTFSGWNTEADGTGTAYAAGDKFNLEGPVTLYAQYTINSYMVTFKDWDGSVLDTETVNHGDDATPPEDPERTGHTFTGWDKSYENVTEDLTITAQYAINTYTVIFEDWDGTELDRQTVNYGDDATPPTDPERTGHTFTGWDKSYENVTEDLTITAQYEINVYKVRFIDWDDSLIVELDVPHGSNAAPPDDPERPGYTFTGWLPVGNQTLSYSANNSIRGMSTTVMSNPYDNVIGPLTLQAQYTADDQPLIVRHTIYSDREQKVIMLSASAGPYYLPTDEVITVADYAIVPHPGYDMTTSAVTHKMAPGLVNFVNIFYTPQEQGYTVHYYLEGTTDPVAPDKSGTGVTMQSITESPVDIEGYEPVSADDVTIQLTADPENNIITFFYTEVEEIVETQPPLGPVSPEPTETPEPTESLEPVETVPEETSPAAPALPVTGENPLDWVLMVGALVVATGAVLLFTRRKKQREE